MLGESGGEGNASGDQEATVVVASTNRRGSKAQVTEMVDELTVEARRETLLDQMEAQLKPNGEILPGTVSRLLFAIGVPDERKTSQVDQAFQEWLRQQSDSTVTGVLLYIGPIAVHFLEGPTEMLFKALSLFNTFCFEVVPAPNVQARPALIGSLRVLYFTEMHGVRSSIGWCSYAHNSKLVGSQSGQLEEGSCPDLVFLVYQKLMVLCLKVQDNVLNNGDKVVFETVQGHYRRLADLMPTADDTSILMAKNSADFFFTYDEFGKVFRLPFHCVLHSELLWPIPPALSY